MKSAGEFFVIYSEEVKDRRLKVVHVNGILNRVDGGFDAFPEGCSRLHSAAGHPNGEGGGMVVKTPDFAVLDVSMDEGGSAELAA